MELCLKRRNEITLLLSKFRLIKSGIAAGFCQAGEDAANIKYFKQTGLNTVIACQGTWPPDSEPQNVNYVLDRCKRWSSAAKANNLHCFIAYAWQLQDPFFIYRHAVLEDGTVTKFVCPLDTDFWTNHITRVGKIIATLSLDPAMTVDGIVLDSELYGTESLPANQRDYSQQVCFCDNCKSLSLDEKKAALYTLAKSCLTEIRKINSHLVFGIYPTLTYSGPGSLGENWVRETIARAWGTIASPIVLFATDTYYVGGYKSIPDDAVELYKQQGIHIAYCAGYTLKSYTSGEIGINVYQSQRRAEGYWLFTMEQLWNPAIANELKQGTQAGYSQSISNANKRKR